MASLIFCYNIIAICRYGIINTVEDASLCSVLCADKFSKVITTQHLDSPKKSQSQITIGNLLCKCVCESIMAIKSLKH